jgi:hypothetical protein
MEWGAVVAARTKVMQAAAEGYVVVQPVAQRKMAVVAGLALETMVGHLVAGESAPSEY